MANNNPEETQDGSGKPLTSNGASANTSAARRSPSQSRSGTKIPTASVPPLQKQASNSLVPTLNSTSAEPSPKNSRNTSPVRKDSRQQPLSNPPATQPSAAAIQRALSATSVPQLQAGTVTEAVSKLPAKATKSAGGSGDTTPRWPTSPRFKSPPPSATNSRRGSAATQQKKSENGTAPNISIQGATPPTATPPPVKQGGDETTKVQQLQTPVKGASRGPSGKSVLETVQENSQDDVTEPSPAAVKAAADLRPLTRLDEEVAKAGKTEGANGEIETQSLHAESGSESAGAKVDKKRDQGSIASRPKNYSSLAPGKSRQSEGKQNMTVETETVQSIPQSQISTGDRSGSTRNDNSGSIRLKPSNETIRPKKERKKPAQKTRSINQGTASSKADIFEARVANAVDEANSSDSEETFVYESNPIEPQRRARHHSRTPSVASSHSMADGQRSAGIRSFAEAMDDRRVAGKRSMKFSNNAYNGLDSPDTKDGSIRSHTPRHIGRFGRGGSHASTQDTDSPFTVAQKTRAQQLGLRHSRPNSPRSPRAPPQQRASALFGGRKSEPSFDFDAESGDIDERTPLTGTVRTPRNGRYPRRINSHADSIDGYYGVPRNPRCGRYGGCMLGVVVFAAAILSAVAFLVMSNRPMYDVEIRKIQNVLASEQELMLDLLVGAVNPNALSISVTDMDINIFAKSKNVGSGEGTVFTTSTSVPQQRRRQRTLTATPDVRTHGEEEHWHDLSDHWHPPAPAGGVDKGTDPPDDDLESQTMLLGRILHFDQGLEFEGSPLKRHIHYSVGELRLDSPGNKTENGGSARWERVLQDPFELIVKGVLKYQLPISSRIESTAVAASITVHPEDGVDEFGNMRLEEVDLSEHWQWIDKDELESELDQRARRRIAE